MDVHGACIYGWMNINGWACICVGDASIMSIHVTEIIESSKACLSYEDMDNLDN